MAYFLQLSKSINEIRETLESGTMPVLCITPNQATDLSGFEEIYAGYYPLSVVASGEDAYVGFGVYEFDVMDENGTLAKQLSPKDGGSLPK